VLLACAVAAQEKPGDVLGFPLEATTERTAALLTAIDPDAEYAGDPTEAVLPYAGRGLIGRQQWNSIIRGVENHLWLYGMAEFGYAIDDDVPAILNRATADRCEVRVLLLSPSYPGLAAIDADEGNPPGTLHTRIQAALARFAAIQAEVGPSMLIRTYDTRPTASVVRGDDRMLVTPYLRFTIGSNSPTFELTEASARKMFGRYVRHLETMWPLAKDWT